jgi:hypothetical protein
MLVEGERMAEQKRMTGFRLPVPLIERLREAAELDRRSMTRALEEAIEMYCDRVDRERGNAKAA